MPNDVVFGIHIEDAGLREFLADLEAEVNRLTASTTRQGTLTGGADVASGEALGNQQAIIAKAQEDNAKANQQIIQNTVDAKLLSQTDLELRASQAKTATTNALREQLIRLSNVTQEDIDLQARLNVAQQEYAAKLREATIAAGGEIGGAGGTRGRTLSGRLSSIISTLGIGGEAGIGSQLAGVAGITAAFTVVNQIRDSLTAADELNQKLDVLNAQINQMGQGDQFGKVRDNILQTATATGVAAGDVADLQAEFLGLYQNVDQANTATADAAKLILVTGESASQAGPQIAAMAEDFGATVNTIGNQVIAARDATGRSAADIQTAFAQVSPVAKELNLTIDQTRGLIEAVGVGSAKTGQMIGDGLARVLPELTKNLPKLSETLGVQFSPEALAGNASAALRDLLSVYQQLNPAQQQFLIATLGGPRNAQVLASAFQDPARALGLLNSQLTDNNLLNQQAQAAANSLRGEFNRLKQELVDLGEAFLRSGIGAAFSDILQIAQPVLKALTDLVKIFGELNDATGGWLVKIGLLVAALEGLSKLTFDQGLLSVLRGGLAASGPSAEEGAALMQFMAGQAPAALTLRQRLFPSIFNRGVGSEAAAVAGEESPGLLAGLGSRVSGALAAPISGAGEFAIGTIGATVVADRYQSERNKVQQAAQDYAAGLKTASDEQVNAIATAKTSFGNAVEDFIFGVKTAAQIAQDEARSRQTTRAQPLLTTIGQGRGTGNTELDLFGHIDPADLQRAAGEGVSTPRDFALNIGGQTIAGHNLINISHNSLVGRIAEAITGGKEDPAVTVIKQIQKNKEVTADEVKKLIDFAAKGDKAAQDALDALDAAGVNVQQLLQSSGASPAPLTPAAQNYANVLARLASETGQAVPDLQTAKALFQSGDLSYGQYMNALQAEIDALAGAPDPADALKRAKDMAELAKEYSAELASKTKAEMDSAKLFGSPNAGQNVNDYDISLLTQELSDPKFTDLSKRMDALNQIADLASKGVKLPPDLVNKMRQIMGQNIAASDPATQNVLAEFQGLPQNVGQQETLTLDQLLADATAAGKAPRDILIAKIQADIEWINKNFDNLESGDASPQLVQHLEAQRQAALAPALQALKDAQALTDFTPTGALGSGSTDSQYAIDQAQRRLDVARAGGDPIAAAQAAIKDAQEGLQQSGLTTVQRLDLETQLQNAQNQLLKAEGDATKAQLELVKAQAYGDPIRQAQITIQEAQSALQQARGPQAIAEAQRQLVDAQEQLIKNQEDVVKAQLSLVEARQKAAGDPVAAAQTAVTILRSEINAELQLLGKNNPMTDPEYLSLQAQLVTAQQNVVDTQISQTEKQIRTQLDLNRITVGQAVAQLQQLKALATSQDQRDQIDLEIKQLLSKNSNLEFNLPSDIGLPTLYEARRLNQTGAMGTSYDARQITINMNISNTLDAQTAQAWISQAVGVNGSQFGSTGRIY